MSTFDKRNLIFRPWIFTMSHVPVPIPPTSLFLILLPTNINIVSDSGPWTQAAPGSTHLRLISIWLRLWPRAPGNGAVTRLTAGWRLTTAPRLLLPSNFLLVRPGYTTRIVRDWNVLNVKSILSGLILLAVVYKQTLRWQSSNNISWVFALSD